MKEQKKNLLYWMVSAVLVICFFLFSMGKRPDGKVDIVFLGDSIIGTTFYELHCLDILEEETGMTVFNGAFGGSSMSFIQTENTLLEQSLWCMAELAEAVCYEDFSSQRAAIAYGEHYKEYNRGTLDYFRERMDALSEIDFSKVEILVIEHGVNDYSAGVLLENSEDLYDKNTFGGALRSSLKLLTENYPNLRIIIMSPIYCEFGDNREAKCYNTSYGGGTLDKYVEKEKEIAEEFGVEFLDAYHGSGIWEDNAKQCLPDGLHPTETGQKILGEFLTDYFLR